MSADLLEEGQSTVAELQELCEELTEHLSCAAICTSKADFLANVEEAESTLEQLRQRFDELKKDTIVELKKA